jgi:hypothetical protein
MSSIFEKISQFVSISQKANEVIKEEKCREKQ